MAFTDPIPTVTNSKGFNTAYRRGFFGWAGSENPYHNPAWRHFWQVGWDAAIAKGSDHGVFIKPTMMNTHIRDNLAHLKEAL